MNGKKTTKEILDFYSDVKVVKIYDNKRFSGHGGKYVNKIETSSISRYVKGGSMLELGPGTGRLTKIIKNKLEKITCLDSSMEMLKLLKKSVKVNQIVNQSIFDKIKTSEKYDYITALRFFDHFSYVDQNKIIKNILPKLRKGGKIIYSALNRKSTEGLLSVFFYFSRTNYFYSFEEYNKLFRRNNLKVVSFRSDLFLPRGMYLRFKNNSIIFNIIKKVDELMVARFNRSGSLYTFVLESKK